MSISVFSIASFISMVALLVQLHLNRFDDYPNVPVISLSKILWKEFNKIAAQAIEYGNTPKEL
jgi:hypothetical protein